MDWQIERESVEAERLIANLQQQAVIEGEVALPGSMRDAVTVLSVQAQAVPGAAEVQNDKVTVSGQVVFHVLYTQGDLTHVQTIETACDFHQIIESPGITPRMQLQWRVNVEDAGAKANGGRLQMTAALTFYAVVTACTPVDAVTDIQGASVLKTKKQCLQLCRTTGIGSDKGLVREEFDLPGTLGIEDTLYATANARVEDVVGGEGRVSVAGTIELTVYHAGKTGKPLVVTRHSMPFEQAVTLNTGENDTISASVQVLDVMVDSMEEGEDARILRAEVEILVSVKATECAEHTLLDDAYTTEGEQVVPSRSTVEMHTDDLHCSARESGKLMLAMPDDAQPIGTMLCAFIQPAAGTRENVNGRLRVDGMLGVTLVYLPMDSDVPVSVHQDTPFTMQFTCDLPSTAAITLECVEAVAAALTSDRVEVRFILALDGTEFCAQSVDVVTDVDSVAIDEEPGGIVLYYPKDRETMWDVAKRYRVAEETLAAFNPQVKEVQPARPLVILKRGAREV